MKLNSAKEILEYAIQKEQEAADFYNKLAELVERAAMKTVLQGFAREELGHKSKLESVRAGNRMLSSEKKIVDLKIGDHLVDIEMRADLGYQEALIIAMKAEKEAFRLYTNLAASTDDPELRDLLLSLAQEEAKHKLRFELEYDDHVLTEN